MGNRGNIALQDRAGTVWFYTHWRGSDLPTILRHALSKGKNRWGDPQYLNKIILNELTEGNIDGETGFGISAFEGDNENPIIFINHEHQTVSIDQQKAVSFDEFVSPSVC